MARDIKIYNQRDINKWIDKRISKVVELIGQLESKIYKLEEKIKIMEFKGKCKK